jgi:hypothetical protein
VGTAEIIIDPGPGVIHKEVFIDPRTGVRVKAEFYGWGTFWVNRLTTPGSNVKIPADMVSINRYYEITKTSGIILDWALIHIPYSLSDIPEGHIDKETKLKLYSWSSVTNDWILSGSSSVDVNSNFVFGNTTHFTLFAVLIDLSEPAPSDDDDDEIYSTAYLLIIFLLVAVVIVTVIMVALVQFRPETMERILRTVTGKEYLIGRKPIPRKPVRTVRYQMVAREKEAERDIEADDELEE